MNIVLDTNVLVSGLLSPFGVAAKILRLIGQGKINLLHDSRILTEYKEVLLRPKFKFNPEKIKIILDYLEASGIAISALPIFINLPDPKDIPFLEVALTGHAHYLVTFNLKHFPKKLCKEILVVNPSNFLKEIQS